MRKTLVITVAVVALLAAGCGKSNNKAKGPSGPQTYTVDADAAAPPQFQISTYFPGALTVRPGDTIHFANKSTAHPHTVSFGILANNSNRPPQATPAGANN